ncbi:MAG: hypothetical protein Q8M95_14190 [Candidatus Methanoperedens sp.]|nr:hypothetical protein [Candidatus Methanoperedens sp.]
MPVTKFSSDIELFFRKLKRLPFVLLGDKIKARQEKFYNLRIALRQARVPMSYEMYISNALFYSVISGIIGALIGLLIAYIVVSVVGLPPALTRLTFSESTAWLLKYRNISISIFIMFFLTALFGGITYGLFLLFPRRPDTGSLLRIDLRGNGRRQRALGIEAFSDNGDSRISAVQTVRSLKEIS